MSTSATSAVGSSSSNVTQTNTNSQLDRNAFLKLLITQLRNQDPLSPMDDKEFITQLAQFSTLEQTQALNGKMDIIGGYVQGVDQTVTAAIQSQSGFSALTLIGKTVEAYDPDDKTGLKTIKGTVDGVKFEDGIPILKIGDKDVLLSHIKSVS